jgi:hypothetical protein
LERADEIRDGVLRIVFSLGLLFLLLIGLIDVTAFAQVMFGPRFKANIIDFGFGTLGSASLLITLWTLLKVRRLPLWRLVVLSALSAVFATLGFGLVVGAH